MERSPLSIVRCQGLWGCHAEVLQLNLRLVWIRGLRRRLRVDVLQLMVYVSDCTHEKDVLEFQLRVVA